MRVSDKSGFYQSMYRTFQSDAQARVRAEAFGEDIGQNSWLTVDELRRFIAWLELSAESQVLEVACGSGGPAMFLAGETGCRLTGVDINESAIDVARGRAEALGGRVQFEVVDGAQPLPFDDGTFDAVFCNDSVNHLRDRLAVFRDWHRVLKPGGRVLYTDPIVITGPLSNEEIAMRASIGWFSFVPLGYNERVIEDAGLTLERVEEVTENTAQTSTRWHVAREKYRTELVEIEGEQQYAATQDFLAMVRTLSSERRLSRFAYLARK